MEAALSLAPPACGLAAASQSLWELVGTRHCWASAVLGVPQLSGHVGGTGPSTQWLLRVGQEEVSPLEDSGV